MVSRKSHRNALSPILDQMTTGRQDMINEREIYVASKGKKFVDEDEADLGIIKEEDSGLSTVKQAKIISIEPSKMFEDIGNVDKSKNSVGESGKAVSADDKKKDY